jgi:hypothetical protein
MQTQYITSQVDVDERFAELVILNFSRFGDPEAEGIYNPSTPFTVSTETGQKEMLLARVEPHLEEHSSTNGIFDLESMLPASEAMIMGMQDPYSLGRFCIDGKISNLFGGVKIDANPEGDIIGYTDHIYQCSLEQGHPLLGKTASDVVELDVIVKGIESWKDLRIFQLPDNTIAVFPRPQGGDFGGAGSIGFFISNDIRSVSLDLQAYAARADQSTLLSGLFAGGEWGGVNQIKKYHSDGTFELYGHRARWVERDGKRVRDYEAIYFEFNRFTKKISNLSVVSPPVAYVDPKKFLDRSTGKIDTTLGIVYFTSGEDRSGNLYLGHGDRKIVRVPAGHKYLQR